LVYRHIKYIIQTQRIVLPIISAQANMGVYPATSSTLQGPSVSISNDIQLHRLFERNESAYPEHMALMHVGMNIFLNIFYTWYRKLELTRIVGIRVDHEERVATTPTRKNIERAKYYHLKCVGTIWLIFTPWQLDPSAAYAHKSQLSPDISILEFEQESYFTGLKRRLMFMWFFGNESSKWVIVNSFNSNDL